MRIEPSIKKDLKIRLKEDLSNLKKTVTIVSAYQLNKEDIDEIMNQFPELLNKPLKYQIDKTIIAGYIIKIGSKMIDISLKGRLQNLRNLIYEFN